ncbi:maltose ABC transporter permease [Paenibacillus baekrokdamisoli]|uniref:Maltose ABC transporter permease n=1 Tax=Paenibacillus baekrokdamisoli TaxID=1712516 RepID=A0A3G9J966_9BACL|nr:ABC transporter permease subunit [Paenibacillus baekrokdamisoli]MBB3072105.1 putative aldouronate transport system permease protein [Paenibacillus baekrokdamisoli]BBH20408.1 maltose ABC transporter permease [Paenibacillus baekrokdamisoli]
MASSLLWKRIWKHKLFYLFMLPGIIWFFLFSYVPLYSIQVAFRDFTFSKGFTGSAWAGLKYFRQFFDYYQSGTIIRNTIIISLMKLLIGFPMPIILAILLNEVHNRKFKKIVQTLSYLPYFVSWIVVITLMQRLLTPYGGPINDMITSIFGSSPIQFLNNTTWFYQVVVGSDIWKNIGWSSIIYMATISSIDQQLYEAAKIDGAGRFRQMWHVTLPGIRGIAVILFILATGSLMSAGYEQLLLLNGPATTAIGSVLDVHVINSGISAGRLSYAAAVGLFQSLIALILIVTVNRIARKFSDVTLF